MLPCNASSTSAHYPYCLRAFTRALYKTSHPLTRSRMRSDAPPMSTYPNARSAVIGRHDEIIEYAKRAQRTPLHNDTFHELIDLIESELQDVIAIVRNTAPSE